MERKYLEALLDPSAYDEPTHSVELIQTHVSYLFLTDRHVYKVKKPVDFGFLNFTTLDRRRFYCEEEVRLNRRLCPDIYLGVVELREHPGRISFQGPGNIVDYAVKMKRLPAERMLDRLLEEGRVSGDDIRRIARAIGEFHLTAERSREIDGYGSPDVIRANWEENFRQMAEFVPAILGGDHLGLIRDWVDEFLRERGDLFQARISGGHIRDCDGDIHGENICLDDKVYIFDCIEFNPRFRFSDTAADIAFLLMDLEYRGRRGLAEILLDEYLRVTGDRGMPGILDFYLVYRAFVRGKVESFRLRDSQISQGEKEQAGERARRHFSLARGYILRRRLPPCLILFSGLMGTGKSTLARLLGFELGLDTVSSDMLRKELAGIAPTERRSDGYNEGIYSADFTRATYDEMFRRAGEAVCNGRGLILDASFFQKKERARFAALARESGVLFRLFHIVCPEDVVRRRLESRAYDPYEVSDGRWELLSRQRRDFEALTGDEGYCVEIDSSASMDVTVDIMLHELGAY